MTFDNLDKMTRREVRDETGEGEDLFITPQQMLDYANEAEAEACRRAKILVDSDTEAICRIPLVAGTSVYPLDPRIISIRRVKLPSKSRPLPKALFWEMDETRPGWEDRTGTVEAIVTGMDTGKIRFYRIPDTVETVRLTVVRLPLKAMTKREDSPEINTRYHRSLIYWMKHKIYNNQDSELFDANRRDINLALFEQEFGPKSAAVNEVFEEMNYEYGVDGGYY